MFFVIMDFLKTLFFLSWTPICIQVLEAVIRVIKCKCEVIINLPSQNKWANGVNQSNLGTISTMSNCHQDNWSNLLFVAKFSYNNMMHSTTQLTPFFANHGLHPKFDI
jgi:hypothetical protein